MNKNYLVIGLLVLLVIFAIPVNAENFLLDYDVTPQMKMEDIKELENSKLIEETKNELVYKKYFKDDINNIGELIFKFDYYDEENVDYKRLVSYGANFKYSFDGASVYDVFNTKQYHLCKQKSDHKLFRKIHEYHQLEEEYIRDDILVRDLYNARLVDISLQLRKHDDVCYYFFLDSHPEEPFYVSVIVNISALKKKIIYVSK